MGLAEWITGGRLLRAGFCQRASVPLWLRKRANPSREPWWPQVTCARPRLTERNGFELGVFTLLNRCLGLGSSLHVSGQHVVRSLPCMAVSSLVWSNSCGRNCFVSTATAETAMCGALFSVGRARCRLFSLSRHNLDDFAIFNTVASAPVLRLPLEKGADGSQVAFVAQEVCLLLSFRPELDGV
jgi:hypothetical protein